MTGAAAPGRAAPPTREPAPGDGRLPPASSVLAVCAHPDDESFGLGAVLDRFAAGGTSVAALCFTAGERSTLGPAAGGAALGAVRRAELAAAAAVLGVGPVALRDHPDGALASVGLEILAREVALMARQVAADLLLAFDEGGVTGHPDHQRATEAALAGAPGVPVLAWTVPASVGGALRAELGARFAGREPREIDLELVVDRGAQERAIACHESQSTGNAVLWRRLALLGDRESLRWLRRPPPGWWDRGAAGRSGVRPGA